MIILSIETSCDDTAIALVKKTNNKINVISSALSSQHEINKKWGGVYPFEAKREHQKNLVPVLEKTLHDATFLQKGSTVAPPEIKNILHREDVLLEKLVSFLQKYKIKPVDAIAVTVGPGLEPCLWAGINFARALSVCLNVPIIPVNHIKAHISYFLLSGEKMVFPAIALVASGGHTELLLMKDINDHHLIGKTRDDAAGECFDKTARVLGLDYPGGPAIAKLALQWKVQNTKSKIQNIKLPRPMMHSKNYDFSFSGLKTAVLYNYLSKKEEEKTNICYVCSMAKEIEEAITDVLIFKLKKAVTEYKAKTVILGGGVTANKKLQQKSKQMMSSFPGVNLILPSIDYAGDNAQIIGATAFITKERKTESQIKANPNLKIGEHDSSSNYSF